MLLSIIIGAAVGIAFSPVCRIQQVTVIGLTESVATEVAARIKLPPGANTAFLPLRVMSAVADDCYRVKKLVISRRSLRSIAVTVHERKPVAALASDHSYTLIDDDGICLIRTDTPGELPAFKGLVARRPELGEAIPPERLVPLLVCLKGAREVGIEQGLQFDFSNIHLCVLKTSDGVGGKLGAMRDLYRKIVLFGRLLEGLRTEGKRVKYIDVRIENKPTIREAGRD